MKAMILAAGLGTRLRPLTNARPKPLLPIAGRPLIEWNLLLLRRAGVKDVVVNVHYLADQIEAALGDGSRLGMRIRFSREPALLGTGGGVKAAEWFLGGAPFFVLNGDTLLELDLAQVRAHHEARGALATMVVREDPEVDRWGPVEIDADQRVCRINGLGLRGTDAAETVMFAGVHVMDARLLRHVKVGEASSIVDAYVQALREGACIVAYRMTGYWSDIGTPARYEQAKGDVEAGRLRLHERERLAT